MTFVSQGFGTHVIMIIVLAEYIQKGGEAVFLMSLYPCILHTLRVLYDRETLVELVMCLKRLITVAGVRSF